MNNKKFDRTFVAVQRQLKAFNVARYEIGLFHREQDQMLPRLWSASDIIKAIGYLKSMNMKGYDVFIRPEGSQGFIFFDDLSLAKIEQLKSDGLAPALIIESSPMNFHGWIKVSDSPIPEALATAIAKNIAQQYNGDKDSADWRHYGRLAGFTNRKDKHIQANGRQPFVLLNSYNGRLAQNSAQVIEQGLKSLESLQEQQLARKVSLQNREVDPNLKDAFQFYQSELLGLESRYGSNLDCSRADWMIVNKMITKGYSKASIVEAMEQCSPALDNRLNHSDNYIEITIKKAFGLF